MIFMVIAATIVSIVELLCYPIVKLRDPVLFTYHR
jgi:hypothetical protein